MTEKHWTDDIYGTVCGRDCTCGSGKAREIKEIAERVD